MKTAKLSILPDSSVQKFQTSNNMLMKNKQLFQEVIFRLFGFILLLISSVGVRAQSASVPVSPAANASESSTLWYVLIFALVVGLVGAIGWRQKNKKPEDVSGAKTKLGTKAENNFQDNALNAEKELEWLRKNQNLVNKQASRTAKGRKRPNSLTAADAASKSNDAKNEQEKNSANEAEKSSNALPIFAIRRLELARPFEPLPISDDESLLDAIDQTQDEFEEDEEIRDLAIRILAAFRARNSVEALSPIALYDLSSSLRSKAIAILAEFDHESVFETILLACADPTREVRAAAARGLTKLTFDRADAWTRIAETGEEGRIVQAARAAIESGFVDMSFDRLVHPDRRYVYEAFALMALLIKAGETEKIFKALENHRDINVRRAILRVIRVTKDQKALDGLYLMLEKNNLPIEFQEEIDKTIEAIGFVTT